MSSRMIQRFTKTTRSQATKVSHLDPTIGAISLISSKSIRSTDTVICPKPKPMTPNVRLTTKSRKKSTTPNTYSWCSKRMVEITWRNLITYSTKRNKGKLLYSMSFFWSAISCHKPSMRCNQVRFRNSWLRERNNLLQEATSQLTISFNHSHISLSSLLYCLHWIKI